MFEYSTHSLTLPKNEGSDQLPITVLFDVSRLANTRLKHSGISRYARELLDHLSKVKEIIVQPVLFYPGELDKSDFKNNLPAFSDYLGLRVITPDLIPLLQIEGRVVQFSPYGPLTTVAINQKVTRCVTIHDILHITMSEFYLAANAASHITNVMNSLSPTDFVMTDSEFTRMELLQHAYLDPEHVSTVALGVSNNYRKRSKSDVKNLCANLSLTPGKYFVLFGQKDPRKNVSTTLEGIRRFLMANPDTDQKFLVIGSGTNLDRLKSDFESMNLPADKVILFEAPKDDDLAVAYTGARGFLFPSLGEGFGLPPLEAMSCGCPIITSAVSSLPEVVRGAGFYINPKEPNAIMKAIGTLSDSDALYKQLSDAALKEAKAYSWTNTAKSTVDWFKKIVTEIEKPVCDVVDAFKQPKKANLLGANLAWKSSGGDLIETDNTCIIEGAQLPTHVFVEDESEGVHGINIEIYHDSQKLRSSVILRPKSRDRAVIWISQRSLGQDVAKAELYVDIGAKDAERRREDGDVSILDIDIVDLGDGWVRVDVETEWEEHPHQSIRLTLGSRSLNLTTSVYSGKGLEAFELLGAKIEDMSVSDEEPLTALDDNELIGADLQSIQTVWN